MAFSPCDEFNFVLKKRIAMNPDIPQQFHYSQDITGCNVKIPGYDVTAHEVLKLSFFKNGYGSTRQGYNINVTPNKQSSGTFNVIPETIW